MISSSQRPLPDNTRHSQQTNIHAPGGIRTQDLSRRAAAGRSPAEINTDGIRVSGSDCSITAATSINKSFVVTYEVLTVQCGTRIPCVSRNPKGSIFRIISAHSLAHNAEGRTVDRESLLFNAETKCHSKVLARPYSEVKSYLQTSLSVP